ncbi:MAG: molecular chaperone HtpG [Planctomycetota bacterium]|jgi:molecular chaperone HtpG|nr:molecular chaperone HtpG [Planctomycetota bacterium]
MTSANPETRTFQAETRELLDLMINSLYTNREIFLRELVSNASDALDKLRFEALRDPSLRDGGQELRIRLEPDAEAQTLCIDDNGIGMTREEVIENIGTIARSGTRAFVDELRKGQDSEEGNATPDLIGQFGVGFYSAFMAAEKVVVETRKAGEEEAVRWTSCGDGEFTVEDIEKSQSGTRICLHLRKPDTGEDGEPAADAQDFTDEFTLRDVVKRYSDFVSYPIQMDVERTEGEGDDKKTETRTETINSMQPLWTRAKAEISSEEYLDFYRHVSHDWQEPLGTIHFRAEGASEYTALMFIPSVRAQDALDPTQHHSRLSLYVKSVFVMQECEELLPPWLRFVRGLVDSSDLPLNVSRETLQHNRQVGRINKRLVKKVLEALSNLSQEKRAEYSRFWVSLGSMIKEGIYMDDAHRDELAALSLFQSSAGGPPKAPSEDEATETDEVCPHGFTMLSEYVGRMPLAQKAIYYVTGPDRSSVENSPHIEAAREKGYEVLFFVDPVDEWILQRLHTFEDKPLMSLDRGAGDLEEEEGGEKVEEKKAELEPLFQSAQESLDDYVKEVRLSSRLRSSPAVLVSDEGALSPQLEQAFRAAGQEVPKQKRILELNPSHPVLEQLTSLHENPDKTRFHLFVELLHGQALLAEGSSVPDPARFARLVTELMAPGTLTQASSGSGAEGQGDAAQEKAEDGSETALAD